MWKSKKETLSEKCDGAPCTCPICEVNKQSGRCFGVTYHTIDGIDFDCKAPLLQDCASCIFIACDECRSDVVRGLSVEKEMMRSIVLKINARGDACAGKNPRHFCRWYNYLRAWDRHECLIFRKWLTTADDGRVLRCAECTSRDSKKGGE